QEWILIGAPQQVPFGLGVRSKLYVQRRGNAPCSTPEGRLFERLRRQDVQGKKRAQLIKIDVGSELGNRNRRMPYIPLGTQQAFLLPRESSEQDATLGRAQLPRLDVLSHLYQQRYVGRVVQSAVVETIPIHGRAETISVKVRRHYNVLVALGGAHARQHC